MVAACTPARPAPWSWTATRRAPDRARPLSPILDLWCPNRGAARLLSPTQLQDRREPAGRPRRGARRGAAAARGGAPPPGGGAGRGGRAGRARRPWVGTARVGATGRPAPPAR